MKFPLFLFNCLIVLLLLPMNGRAATANPSPTVVKQADGTTLTITIHGDEWFHWTTTTDGYRIVKNAAGVYEYATQLKSGEIVPAGIKAMDLATRTAEEKAYTESLGKNMGVTSTVIQQTREGIFGKSQLKSAASATDFPTSGDRKLLVIMANFSDRETTVTKEQYSSMMNDANYNDTGSFKDYYREISNATTPLNVTSTVTAWVKLSKSHDYYGTNNKEFIYDALTEAAKIITDFSPFDNDNSDGNNTIETVMIVHQGGGGEVTDNTTDIWSHYHTLSSYYPEAQRTFNGKVFDNYVVVPETDGATPSAMTNIGVICHEFGHALGMADYYDTDDESGEYTGTGQWDLMAYGLYNNNSATPAHPNPYEKIKMGWAEALLLQDAGAYSLSPILTGQEVYRLNTAETSKYYLLENRRLLNFDAKLPTDGMLVYKIDQATIDLYEPSNQINTNTAQGVAILPAYGSAYTGYAAFPGFSGATCLSDETNPSSLTWNSTASKKTLTNIHQSGGNILFNYMEAVPQPVVISQKADEAKQVEIKWNPVIDEPFSGYEPFTLTIPDWSFVDLDLAVTYDIFTINNASTTNEYAFPNETYTGSYIVFTPDDPSIVFKPDGPKTANPVIKPYSGSQFLACVAAKGVTNNNDWIISPAITITADTWLSFMARSYHSAYLEKINVLISETGTETTSFTQISPVHDINNPDKYSKVPVGWTMYKFDLSQYINKTIHFAIQCVSEDAYMLMLDNIKITSQEPIEELLKSLSLNAEIATSPIFEKSAITTAPALTLKSTAVHVDNTRYNIYRDGVKTATLSGLTNTTFAETLTTGGTYAYKIEAEKVFTGTTSSTTLSVSVPGATSISANKQGVVWPNPAQDYIVVESGASENVGYKVYNITGSLVLQGTLQSGSMKIDIASLASGIYSLELNKSGVRETHKISKL